ncbi:tetratricopeptide repeat protein [Geomonas sp. Red32]|uniref:CheR family methyltransferase n=1 Tax=Geomonas sp. Red32 TaxID=2912856 RepID=UPI00202CFD68|nr:CheR family methyltransferase [Geomonas sp. Red32]MCM0081695.1 tetratricopeptide repeat protein [Geomonas sp. Red32]
MPLKILLITDDSQGAAPVCRALTAAGYTVAEITSAADPIKALRQRKPDLLIVYLEGARAADWAGDHRLHTPEGPHLIPVIVISDRRSLEAELMNVYDFIPSPPDLVRLLDSVAAIAQRPSMPGYEAALTDLQYQELAGQLLVTAGLHFEVRNRSALERGVRRRMSSLRMHSCSEYLDYLKRHAQDRQEMQKLLQFLTVGETYFFRYPAHFQALTTALLRRRLGEPVRIWSAGCSTGEEPYSIAIALMEALPDWRTRDIRIIATDINHVSLAKARRAVYTAWSLRATDEAIRGRYFTKEGDHFALKEEVKARVEFFHLNLNTPCQGKFCSELKDLDAVFCRNVLIYFSPEAAPGIVASISQTLRPKGLLFLGHAESLLQQQAGLASRLLDGSFYYVKGAPPKAAELPVPPPPPEPLAEPAATPPAAPPPEPPALCPVVEEPRREPMEEARLLYDGERYGEALAALKTILEGTPACAPALVLKGFILAGRGELDAALELCIRAIAVDDLFPDAYFLRGVVLDGFGLLAEAANEYRKALLLNHDFIMPRYHLGQLHLKLGKVPEAAREIRNSITILTRSRGDETVPYSGGLSRARCLEQLQSVLNKVA